MMLFLLLSLVGFLFTASSSSESLATCEGNKTISLNSSGWSIPLTAMAPSQYCTYIFFVPQGFFAIANVSGRDYYPDKIDWSTQYTDEIVISDSFGENRQYVSFKAIYSQSSFDSNLAWPSNFFIHISTWDRTKMKIQINITLEKNVVGQNVVQRMTTALNAPSRLLYIEDLQEGQTYVVSAKNTVVNIKVAYGGNSSNIFHNIFVYDNGTLVGTLLGALENQGMVSQSNQVELYVAKSLTGLTLGAVHLTDNSNIIELASHFIIYAYMNYQTFDLQGNDQAAGAMTVVGKKDGSTPFDIIQLNTFDLNNGTFSYIKSGPMQSQTGNIPLNPSKLPIHIRGNINTFYISRGLGIVQITLT